jgi:hypothetical protein
VGDRSDQDCVVSQPVRSLRSCFRVCENRRHFRGSGPGRISVAKRRHGLRRCRYKGYVGMHRWVGLGVIADNLVNIGLAIEKQTAP